MRYLYLTLAIAAVAVAAILIARWASPLPAVAWPASAQAQEHDEHDGHDHAAAPEHDEPDEHDGHDHADEAAEAHDAHDEDGHDDHEGHGDEEEESAIRITEAVMQEFDIATAAAGPGTLRTELRVPGEVVVNPNLVAHVVPRAPGIARQVDKQIGDRVEAGEVLAVLDSPTLSEAKAAYLNHLQELELNRLDAQRAQTIAENTAQAVSFLKAEPDLAALAELESLDLGGMRRDLIGSYAAMVAARTTLERKRQLHSQKIASDAELQEADSAYKQARADYLAARDALSYENQRNLLAANRQSAVTDIQMRAAERHLHALGLDEAAIEAIPRQHDIQLSRLDIVSPIDGIITERHLVRGEKVDDSEAAFVIADYQSVWVYLTLYQKDMSIVQAGMPVQLTLTGTEVRAAGTVDLVSPIVDEATRTATARVVLDNASGHWRPGAFVTGLIAVSRRDAAVVVPRQAVITVDNRPSVFVRIADGFEVRVVQTGLSDADHIEIVDGLSAGEVYASRNILPLKAELDRAALEHAGHAH